MDALIVTINHADLNANSRLGLRSKTLVAGNLVVNFHSTEAGAVSAVTIQLLSLHSAVRGR